MTDSTKKKNVQQNTCAQD